MTLGEKLEKVIRKLNISKSDFAKSLGISPNSLTHYLKDRRQPKPDFFERMAEKYPQVNIAYFFTDDEIENIIKNEMRVFSDSVEPLLLFHLTDVSAAIEFLNIRDRETLNTFFIQLPTSEKLYITKELSNDSNQEYIKKIYTLFENRKEDIIKMMKTQDIENMTVREIINKANETRKRINALNITFENLLFYSRIAKQIGVENMPPIEEYVINVSDLLENNIKKTRIQDKSTTNKEK